MRKSLIAYVPLLVVTTSVQWAAALPRCIPPSGGVPGTTLSGLPPNWWNQALLFPRYDTRFDAPSWQGAKAHSHPFGGTGTVEDMQFRAMHKSEGAVEYLYLSWTAKVVPDLDSLGKNLVWFGLGPSAGTTGIAIKIQLDQTTNQTDALPPAYIAQIRVFDGTNWGPYTPSGGAAAFPPWLNGTTTPATDGTARVWIDHTLNRWAVNIRIPMSATATNTNLDSGINLGTEFKLWYEFRISSPSATNAFIPYKWPTGVADMDLITDNPRPPSEWDLFRLGTATSWDPPDPACVADGVSLRGQDVGSDHPSGSTYISLTNPNVFHARPFNHHTTDAANGVKARFRIANWGAGPTREDVPNPTTTLWQDIADPNGVPQPNGINILANTQGTITTPYTVTSLCDRCRYGVFYTPNKPSCDTSCPVATNNMRATHQCILVELTGAGVNFLNTSAWQNMNYATTSTFSESAEINIKDLPGLAGGKDVYLYVRALNMPAEAKPGTPGIGPLPIPGWPPPEGPEDDKTPSPQPSRNGDVANVAGVAIPGEQGAAVPARSRQLITALRTALALGQIEFDQLSQSMPTLTVHAYYDTGLRNTAGGGSRPILRPLTSFGYFVVHDGDVGGWKYALQSAQLIAPNWYKVAVPASGIATVTTVVESLPPVRPIPWLLILILLVVLLLIMLAYLWSKAHP